GHIGRILVGPKLSKMSCVGDHVRRAARAASYEKLSWNRVWAATAAPGFVLRERRLVMSSTHKVAVITGASQGIGAGLVRGFLDRGFRVVANSRSIEVVASADMLAIAGDIADPAVADRVIGGAVETFGRVDTLVNNAGIFIAKPFTDYTEGDFAAKISVNLAGFFYVSQRAVRQMLTQGGGH